MALLPWIQMGVQGLTSGFNTLMQNRLQKKQFAHDRSMAEYAYSQDQQMWDRQSQWNTDMWRMQNEYNLPANQMSRLKDAGLNPNLIYGNAAAGGQAAAIQKAEMPKYQPARADYNFLPLEVPQMLSMYQDFKLRNAQHDNLRAQQLLTQEKAVTEGAIREATITKAGHEAAKAGFDTSMRYRDSQYQHVFQELEAELKRKQLANLALDKDIKGEMVGKTRAERGLREKELKWMEGFDGARPQDWMRALEQFLKFYVTKK